MKPAEYLIARCVKMTQVCVNSAKKDMLCFWEKLRVMHRNVGCVNLDANSANSL